MKKKIITASILALISATLTGCGGGGSSPANVIPSNDDPFLIVPDTGSSLPSGYSKHVDAGDDYNLTESSSDAGVAVWRDNGFTGQGVSLAIIDSGISPDARNDLNIVADYNAVSDSNGNKGLTHTYSDEIHGTKMSQISASQEFGIAPNVDLYNVTATEVGSREMGSYSLYDALSYVETNIINIANVSYEPNSSLVRVVDQDAYDTQTQNIDPNDPFIQSMQAREASYTNLKNNGTIVVNSAGNNGGNLTDVLLQDDKSFGTDAWVKSDMKDSIVYVGGAVSPTSGAESWSATPGTDVDIQDRFILAPIYQQIGSNYVLGGTSGAAAIVSGSIALMKERWNHLTASQASQILLDTADNTYSGYSIERDGQGYIDMVSAWSPQGKTSIPYENGQQTSVSAASIPLPAGFKSASVTTAVVDKFKRDYMVTVASTEQTSYKSRAASMGMMVKPYSVSRPLTTGSVVSTFDANTIANVNREQDGMTFLGMGNEFDTKVGMNNTSKISLGTDINGASFNVAFTAPRDNEDNKGVMTQLSLNGFTVGAYANAKSNKDAFYGADNEVTTGALIEYSNKGLMVGAEAASTAQNGKAMIKDYSVNTGKLYVGATANVNASVKVGVMGYTQNSTANINVNAPTSNGDGSLRYESQKVSSSRNATGVSLSAQAGNLTASVLSDDIDQAAFVGYNQKF